jgi:hypothetical protein
MKNENYGKSVIIYYYWYYKVELVSVIYIRACSLYM